MGDFNSKFSSYKNCDVLQDFKTYINERKLDFENDIDLAARNQKDFDILYWWCINEKRFPVLAMIAQDFLAIQAGSTPSESTSHYYYFTTFNQTSSTPVAFIYKYLSVL